MKEVKISIKYQSKGKPVGLPFQLIKNEILGRDYELSVVFADAKTSQALNKRFRGKNKPTNILSFPLTKKSGEIVFHLPTVRKDMSAFSLTFKNFLGLLFIHGLLHLKGMQHSSKMESKERLLCKHFHFN